MVGSLPLTLLGLCLIVSASVLYWGRGRFVVQALSGKLSCDLAAVFFVGWSNGADDGSLRTLALLMSCVSTGFVLCLTWSIYQARSAGEKTN